MKNIIKFTWISSIILLTISCSSEYEMSNDLKFSFQALSMQILEEEPLIAKDTGYFSLTASNPSGKIVKLSVNHLTDFEGLIENTNVQVPYDVKVNSQGEFSRPISTILLQYPIVATAVPGEILSAEFTFTDDNGNIAKVSASKKVVNFKTNGSQQFLFVSRPLHSFYTGLSYGAALAEATTTFKDSLDIFWSRTDGIQYLSSPDSETAADEFSTRYATTNYVQSDMQNIKIIKLDVSLAEVDDDFFANMDFSSGVDTIVVDDGAVYGVLLSDGRKAAIEIQIYFTQFSRVRSKVQVSPD
jgi:hypothetical protein